MSLRRSLNRILGYFGYEVIRNKAYCSDPEYEVIRPLAQYAPWNSDEAFGEMYEKIKDHTLVDKYRCFELWTLLEQAKKADGAIIEVGVWKGGTGALLAKRARICGMSDPIYLCDTFEGLVKVGERDTYRGGEYAVSQEHVKNLISDHVQVDDVKVIKGTFPEESAHQVDANQFRFCHIDVDVYQSAVDVIDWIWDKMSVGGIIVFDDYGFGCFGIVDAVEEQRNRGDRILIHNLNGHAVLIKIK